VSNVKWLPIIVYICINLKIKLNNPSLLLYLYQHIYIVFGLRQRHVDSIVLDSAYRTRVSLKTNWYLIICLFNKIYRSNCMHNLYEELEYINNQMIGYLD
jgi:hypothetical protein